MARVAIVGGGGFAKEVIEVARMLGHEAVGVFALENSLPDLPHLGYLEEMRTRRDDYDALCLAVGAVNARGIADRRRIIGYIRAHALPTLSLVSPLATVAPSVTIGEGVFIGHEVLISCDARIGDFVLINQRAVIGHDARIDENVSVAPLVFLGGNVRVEADTMLGVRATVRQGLRIGQECVVGMGSLVIKNLKPRSTTLQMPSKIYREPADG